MNINRNDQCWCGSGQKYKKCHLLRPNQVPNSKFDIDIALSYYSKESICLYPDNIQCSGKAINSHIVSKGLNLKHIQENGHVLSFKFRVNQTLESYFEPKLVGINMVTTLPCFCSFHDNKTFGRFERTNFLPTKENIFYLSFRSFAREYYEKLQVIKVFEIGKGYYENNLGKGQFEIIKNAEYGALRNLEEANDKFKRLIRSKSFDKIESRMFQFENDAPFHCSGMLFFDIDIAGKILQNLDDHKSGKKMLFVNTMRINNRNHIIFSWFNDSMAMANEFIQSVSNSQNRDFDIIYFCLVNFSNICMKPSWYNSQPKETKAIFRTALIEGAKPFVERANLFPPPLGIINIA